MTTHMHPWTKSRAAERLGIAYPVVQGPFGGLSSVALAASVSNSGGMGSIGAARLSAEQIHETVAQLREQTTKPFSMNIWVSTHDEDGPFTSSARIDQSALAARQYFRALNVAAPPSPSFSPSDFKAQSEALLTFNPPVASFTFGIPPKSFLQECRSLGILTMAAVTTVDEAKLIADSGIDVVVASGFEAGGHRGSFLASAESSLTRTFALIPQVADEVDIPVIAAGGIADARGIVAALALGADAVQIGTAFLVCEGSGINPLHRQVLFSDAARMTGLTKYFSVMDAMERSMPAPLPYPLHGALMGHYTMAAASQQHVDLLPLWGGQAAALIRHTTVEALMRGSSKITMSCINAFAIMQYQESTLFGSDLGGDYAGCNRFRATRELAQVSGSPQSP